MSTTSQIDAFVNPENKVRRISQKERIFKFLKSHKGRHFTYPDVSAALDIKASSCQARMSELRSDGKIKVVGDAVGHSLYMFGDCKILLTKDEAFRAAISEFCPMFLDEILNRVKELTK